MSSKQTATIEACGNGFAVAVGGEIVRTGFVSRGHAAMWAARQRLYERTRRQNCWRQLSAIFGRIQSWPLGPADSD